VHDSCPELCWFQPEAQVSHAPTPTTEAEYFPAGHSVQPTDPPSAYLPEPQIVHPLDPNPLAYLPEAQSLQEVAPAALANVPFAQSTPEVKPADGQYVPGWQSLQAGFPYAPCI